MTYKCAAKIFTTTDVQDFGKETYLSSRSILRFSNKLQFYINHHVCLCRNWTWSVHRHDCRCLLQRDLLTRLTACLSVHHFCWHVRSAGHYLFTASTCSKRCSRRREEVRRRRRNRFTVTADRFIPTRVRSLGDTSKHRERIYLSSFGRF